MGRTIDVATPVPFLDLASLQAPVKEAILRDAETLLETAAFTNGPPVAEFERQFARYCGAADCVGVASGLDALRLALTALGLEPEGEVIVPAETFVATLEAVKQAGGKPVIVDVDASDYTIDIDAVEAAITSKTRFVLPVHLYGQLSDMRRLAGISAQHGLKIVADAAQAHGASRDGVGAAGLAHAAAFSFYPGKNLGAIGDAGAIVVHDRVVAQRLRALREHGQTAKYHHEWEGWTSRLDTLQAIALLHKLPLLNAWNEQRREAARLYAGALDGVGDLKLPSVAPQSAHVWHLYVVRTSNPEGLGSFLRERGIGTGRHYPQPPHLSPAFASLGYRDGNFPVAEAISRECLSLPMFPGLDESRIGVVADTIREYFDG